MPSSKKQQRSIDFWSTGDGTGAPWCRVCGRVGGDDLCSFGGQRKDHVHSSCGRESLIDKWVTISIMTAKKKYSKQGCFERALELTRKAKDPTRTGVTLVFQQELEEKIQKLQKEKADCEAINKEIEEKMPEFPKHNWEPCLDNSKAVFQDPAAACRVCGGKSEPVLHFTGLEEKDDVYVHFDCARRDDSEWEIVTDADISNEHGDHWRAVKLALRYTRSADYHTHEQIGDGQFWIERAYYLKREFEKNLSIAAEIYPKSGRRKKRSAPGKRKARDNAAAELENVRPRQN